MQTLSFSIILIKQSNYYILKQFIPFHKIKSRDVVIVDGLHPQNLTLSHWKGTNQYAKIAADTSGEIVLNALENEIEGIHTDLISATHFDIDGFVGVFALFYPELALKYKKELIAMARIGDFREYNHSVEDEFAVKLCCWINTVEKEKFYRPFGEKEEMELCTEKFEFFLPLFVKVITNIENYKKEWIEEYEQFRKGLDQLKEKGTTEKIDDLGLVIRRVPEPIHYYALFSETDGFDIVLTNYNNQRYELEYKYTTWVDIVSRPALPRIDLKPLAKKLNKLENSKMLTWEVDNISDTGPILRLEKEGTSKADRYAHPYERNIYSSGIPEKDFNKLVIDYFRNCYQNIEPKKFWTWKETRELNSKLKV